MGLEDEVRWDIGRKRVVLGDVRSTRIGTGGTLQFVQSPVCGIAVRRSGSDAIIVKRGTIVVFKLQRFMTTIQVSLLTKKASTGFTVRTRRL